MPFFTSFAQQVLREHLGGAHVALFLAAPAEDGSNLTAVEVPGTGTGYARQPVAFGAPAGKTASTTTPAIFGPLLTDAGRVTHVGYMDGAGGAAGKLFFALAEPVDLRSGVEYEFAAGRLRATLK